MSCLCTLIVMISTAAGCGSSPVALGEVSGILTVDGKPAPEIAVDFIPDSDGGTTGPPSSALTDQDGKFTLICRDGRNGAVVGTHRIVLRDNRAVAGAPSMRFKDADKKPKPLPASRISDRYTRALSTPLRQEVKAEPQTIPLEVTKK